MENKLFNENFGWVTKKQLAAYRKFNVSPMDHDILADRYGDDSEAIIADIKRNSLNGYYQPVWNY